jgi:hypothetical protein
VTSRDALRDHDMRKTATVDAVEMTSGYQFGGWRLERPNSSGR